MKDKYLAFDACNGEYQTFDNIEDARKWLYDCFYDQDDQAYDLDTDSCKIYLLHEKVELVETDRKSNYKYECEEDLPDGGDSDDVWPYDNMFDVVGEHRFIPINPATGQ